MRVIVTGGAGFIGSHVADALLTRGHEVCVVDDLSSGRRGNVPDAARFDELDIRDASAVERCVSDFRPEVICHQAAQTSVSVSTREPLRDAAINILGSLNVLGAARANGVARLVFASTGGAIYGEVASPQRADTSWGPKPVSPYACSKFAFENYLHGARVEYGFESTILRYANVYGPRQDPHGEAGVVAIFCDRLTTGQALRVNAMLETGDRGCVRDYVYVGDVVEANVRAVEGRLRAPVLNVGTGVECDTRTLAETLSRAFGVEPALTFGERREGDLLRSVLAPSPELADMTLVGLDEGLRATAEWYRTTAR